MSKFKSINKSIKGYKIEVDINDIKDLTISTKKLFDNTEIIFDITDCEYEFASTHCEEILFQLVELKYNIAVMEHINDISDSNEKDLAFERWINDMKVGKFSKLTTDIINAQIETIKQTMEKYNKKNNHK